MTKVEARFAWLIQVRTATQPVFALRLQHEEPADSFHPLMRAVLATSDDALDCWLVPTLKRATFIFISAVQAIEKPRSGGYWLGLELGNVCREYKIMLKPVKVKGTGAPTVVRETRGERLLAVTRML